MKAMGSKEKSVFMSKSFKRLFFRKKKKTFPFVKKKISDNFVENKHTSADIKYIRVHIFVLLYLCVKKNLYTSTHLIFK